MRTGHFRFAVMLLCNDSCIRVFFFTVVIHSNILEAKKKSQFYSIKINRFIIIGKRMQCRRRKKKYQKQSRLTCKTIPKTFRGKFV